MFGFNHPRPPSRKEVAMQIVQQEARRFSATELTVELPDGPVAPPPGDAPIRFEVACTAAEYRSFVRRMPLCAFAIDAAGIERTTRAGRLVRR